MKSKNLPILPTPKKSKGGVMETWVDFRVVKQAVTMHMILDHYSINWLRKSGKEFRGRCPIHHRSGETPATEKKGSASFHVNDGKNAFNCFSCKAHGNVLDFVAAMEQCSVRDAALKLKEWFGVADEANTKPNHAGPPPQKEAAVEKVADEERVGEPVGESDKNKPLEFRLKSIDYSHAYMSSRGLSKETIERFEIGYFFGQGKMKGRVVIPVHNRVGELIAYVGRAIGDKVDPKYLVPVGFHKSQELFNLHRVLAGRKEDRAVIVVEGYFGCMSLDQAGFPVVALMGNSLSEAQASILVSEFDHVVLMLDGNEAGREGAEKASNQIKHKLFVRVLELGDGQQPDHLSSHQTNELLKGMKF
jgi:DNA primase